MGKYAFSFKLTDSATGCGLLASGFKVAVYWYLIYLTNLLSTRGVRSGVVFRPGLGAVRESPVV